MGTHQHVFAGPQIVLDARQVPALPTSPIRNIRTFHRSPLAAPPVKDNPDIVALPEFLSQRLPQVRLVARDDDQTTCRWDRSLRTLSTSHSQHPQSLRPHRPVALPARIGNRK